ncbi:MAG: alpha/beta hydrolase [Planctomycetia bacterium]|jgi:pimeloyl-ACP methyl ester carboxylesterase
MQKVTTISGFQLAYLDKGAGPVVLLVHGFPMDHSLWENQVQALKDRYRVIVPDLPGFGQSELLSNKELSISLMADALVELLEALGITEPVTLAGLSMGGYVVMDFMRCYADRVERLALFDTRPNIDTPEGIQNREQTAQRALSEGIEPIIEGMIPKLFSPVSLERKSELVEQMRQKMLATLPNTIAAASLAMAARADSTELLAQLKIPTLVMVGEHDIPSPPEVMQQMADSIANATFVQVPAAGHLTPLEQPEIVNKSLLQFLKT